MSVCKQKGKKMVRVKLTWQLTSIIDFLKTTTNNIKEWSSNYKNLFEITTGHEKDV